MAADIFFRMRNKEYDIEVFENFSISLFKHLYYECEEISQPEGYIVEKEYLMNKNIVFAVLCRHELFRCLYRKDFNESYLTWNTSPLIFTSYLCQKFLHFTDYLNPNIYDKVFIVSAFVMEMAISCFNENNEIYLRFPRCFAKYFYRHLRREILEDGGLPGLVNYSGKYQSISAYVKGLETYSMRKRLDQKTLISSLITRINKDYHFENILNFLSKRVSNLENDTNICRKCKFYKGLTTEAILKSCTNNLTFIEGFLQICLKLMEPKELEEFDDKFVDGLKHKNCEFANATENAVQAVFLEPCMKCHILIDTKQATDSGQTEINDKYLKPNFMKVEATKEVIKLMFEENSALQYEGTRNFCDFCFEDLKLKPDPKKVKPDSKQAKPAPFHAKNGQNQAKPALNPANFVPNQTRVSPNQAKLSPNQAKLAPNQAKSAANEVNFVPNLGNLSTHQAISAPHQAISAPDQANPASNETNSVPNQANPAPNQAKPATKQGRAAKFLLHPSRDPWWGSDL